MHSSLAFTLQVKAKVGVPAHESVDTERLRSAIIFAKKENVEIKARMLTTQAWQLVHCTWDMAIAIHTSS